MRVRSRLCGGLFAAFAVLGCSTAPVRPAAAPVPANATPAVEPDEPPTGPSAGDGPDRPPAPEIRGRDEAFAALAHGQPEAAAAWLRTHLSAHPDDGAARLQLARALARLGEDAAAEATLAAATADEPALLIEHAALRLALGDVAGAEARLSRGRTARPDDLSLQGALLGLLVATGRGGEPTARALMDGLYDAYEGNRTRTAEDLLAVAEAAIARGTTGSFKDAHRVLFEAADRAPVASGTAIADAIALRHADLLRSKYDGDQALELYEAVLARDPWHPEALAGAARVQLDRLGLGVALRLAERSLKTTPHHPDAHAIVARIALLEQRRDAARTGVVERVLARRPAHAGGLAVLGALAILGRDDATWTKIRGQALALDRRGRDFFVELADLLAFLHLYPESEAVLAEAVENAPDDPNLLGARGLNLLRLGREAEGRALLERAWKRDRFNARTRNTLELYERRIDPDYVTVERDGFSIRLPKQDHELVLETVVPALRRARAALDTHYGKIRETLRIELYETPEDFSIRTVGVPSLGALAVCFGDLTTFVGPYHGTHNLDAVIWHELAHVYAIRASRHRVPRWFTEGLSEWESEQADPAWAREAARALGAARRAGRLPALDRLETAFLRAESPKDMDLAYATSAWAVRWLAARHGRARIVALLRDFGEGKDAASVFERQLGTRLSALDGEFSAWVGAEAERRVHGWEPPERSRERDDDKARLFARATAELRADDVTSAERTLLTLASRGGDGYAVRLAIAKILLDGPSPQAALPHLEKALGFNREAVEPYVALAELARARAAVADEVAVLERALAIDANAFDPAARLLMLAIASGKPGPIDQALSRAQAVAPLHPIVLAATALREAQAGRRERARSRLERARTALSNPSGPVETFAVGALAAEAAGDLSWARTLAGIALREPGDVAPLAERLRRIQGR